MVIHDFLVFGIVAEMHSRFVATSDDHLLTTDVALWQGQYSCGVTHGRLRKGAQPSATYFKPLEIK